MATEIDPRSAFFEGSLHNPTHRQKAVNAIKSGQPIVMMFRGTFGIAGDGSNDTFVNSVVEIKGAGRHGAPLAALYSAEKLVTMIDTTQLPPSHWITNADEIRSRLSTLCFVRVPIKKEAAETLPSSMVSYSADGLPILQNWFPHGLPVESVTECIEHPAVTSTNYHGEPEIIEPDMVAAFCVKTNIPVFLRDETYPLRGVKGSYTIFSIGKNGIQAVREGNIPVDTFKYIFGDKIDKKETVPAKHPQLKIPSELLEGLTPPQVREAIIHYTEGRFPRRVEHIRRKVTKGTRGHKN